MAADVAFEILYKEYNARVFGLCRRLLGSTDLAKDATQETFVKAYKSFSKYDNKQPFWRWISTIAGNHCVDVLRGQQRTKSLFGDEATELEQIASSTASDINLLIERQESTALTEAIQQLPEKYRVPIVLAYFNEASYEEIAVTLAITRNHVGILLLRGRQMLREQLASGADV